jgi:hypothetical protein
MLSGCVSRSTRVILLLSAVALAGCKDGSIFEIEATSNDKPTIEWTGSHQLTVKYRASTTPIRQVPRYMDVQIEYRPIEAAQTG